MAIAAQLSAIRQKARLIGAAWMSLSFRNRNPRLAFSQWFRSFAPFAIILLLDPLGCSEVADRYSEDILLRLISPYHTGEWHKDNYRSTKGQEKIAVVLIDRNWLDQRAEDDRGTWPIPRSAQILEMLHPILSQSPEAVLLDYTFNARQLSERANVAGTTDPEGPNEIRKLIESERDEHIFDRNFDGASPPSGKPTRIYFGSKPVFKTTNRPCNILTISAADLAKADDVAPELRTWDNSSEQKPAIEIVTLRQYAPVHYPLLPYTFGDMTAGKCGAVEKDTPEDRHLYLASPAYALFAAYCARDPERDQNPLCKTIGKAEPAAIEARRTEIPMASEMALRRESPNIGPASYYRYPGQEAVRGNIALLWPAFRSERQIKNDNTLVSEKGASNREKHINICNDHAFGLIRPAFLLMARLFTASFFRLRERMGESAEPCRYGIDTYSMTTLLALTKEKPFPLTGRYVFVGLDLPTIPDNAPNPLYREAPGVMLHAVALENLISLKNEYLTDSGTFYKFGDSIYWVLIFGFLFSVIPIVLPVEFWARSLLTWPRERLLGNAFLMLATVAVMTFPLVIGWCLTTGLRWAPLNWVSMLLAIGWAPETAYQVLDSESDPYQDLKSDGGKSLSLNWLYQFGLPISAVLCFCVIVITVFFG
ncbi:MAG: hypothetical protein B7Y43_18625 [Sphingomonas sp. 28-62-20]|uniref:CHASE2 domain-containing protein n=1 Tax=Sphingomonas sp. 28-62-20 TaxID=1970433 RepID=UPI000BCE5CE0|nr:MAG: hypothetical protein B7Y43_18625 [Sphingomonas sp. 28-62-20]